VEELPNLVRRQGFFAWEDHGSYKRGEFKEEKKSDVGTYSRFANSESLAS
jgi:hypothetical protein